MSMNNDKRSVVLLKPKLWIGRVLEITYGAIRLAEANYLAAALTVNLLTAPA